MPNELMTIERQTPIEVILRVDEDGKVSAKRLYEFLELDKSNYSKWAKRNIEENEFAEENVDFWTFVLNDERNPNPTTDYKLTAAFAKKLAMGTHNEKGEQAKNYFIKVEGKLKQVAIQVSQLSPELQAFNKLFTAMAQQELAVKKAEKLAIEAKKESEQVKETISNIKDTIAELPKDQWRKWVNSSLGEIGIKLGNKGQNHEDLRSDSYKLLEDRAGADLAARLRNGKKRLEGAAATKTAVREYCKLDCIEEEKRLKEIYTGIIKELRIKYLA